MSDRYKPSGLHGSEAKEYWRNIRTEDLLTACKERNTTYEKLTPYQYRVGQLDFYPTNGNWHNIITNKRGDFHTIKDIYRLLDSIGIKDLGV